ADAMAGVAGNQIADAGGVIAADRVVVGAELDADAVAETAVLIGQRAVGDAEGAVGVGADAVALHRVGGRGDSEPYSEPGRALVGADADAVAGVARDGVAQALGAVAADLVVEGAFDRHAFTVAEVAVGIHRRLPAVGDRGTGERVGADTVALHHGAG